MATSVTSKPSDGQATANVFSAIQKDIAALYAALGSAVLVGSEVYDPASLTTGSGATSTGATVTGAALGDLVVCSFSLDLQGIVLTAYVQAANTVKARFQNQTGGTIDLALWHDPLLGHPSGGGCPRCCFALCVVHRGPGFGPAPFHSRRIHA